MRVLLLAVCFVLGVSAHAGAAESEWAHGDYMGAKLLSAVDGVEGLEVFEAGLQLGIEDGWHTYWRVPGDAGLPPRFDWSGSKNVADVEVLWPAPTRKDENGFTAFAYLGAVILPLDITLAEPGKATTLAVKTDVMICSDICIPQKFEISLDIPVEDGAAASPQAYAIEKARRSVPVMDDTPALKIDTVVVSMDAIVVSVVSTKGVEDIDLFAHADGYGFTAPPVVEASERDQNKAMIKIPKTDDIDNLQTFLAGKSLSLTVVNGERAVEKVIAF